MEEIGDVSDVSDLRFPKDAIIETVAEAVLNEPKPVAVVDDNNQMIGVLNSKTIVHILFGKRSAESLNGSRTADD
jgi:glycine betaine/proline transport system ATP-binding protein